MPRGADAPVRVLIVDDEGPDRKELATSLAATDGIVVVGEVSAVPAARALLRAGDHELVFLGAEFAGGNGFDLMADVRDGVAVVFVATQPRDACRAFDVNAVDYLVKPVRPARLAQALRRAACLRGPGRGNEARPALDDASSFRRGEDRMIFLNSGSHARYERVDDISAIVAQENYTSVRLADGSQVLVRRSLKAWEDMLCAGEFARVHRAVLVNLGRIMRYERGGPKTILLYLSGVPEPIGVSQRAWGELRARLAGHDVAEMDGERNSVGVE